MDLKISGSIVLYKNDASVRTTISDFLSTSLPVRLYLVDNSPTDQLKQDLADLVQDDRVEYLFNSKNLGFGAGHNIAIRKAIHLYPYHLVLNPDVSFKQGVLESLLNYMQENKDVGLVTPKILYPNGEVQYAAKLLPTPSDLIFRRFLPSFVTKKRNEYFEMHGMGYNKEIQVPYLSGCFMFLRTEGLKKVGLFDERFFMYPEDIDLTRRMHREYKTIFYPKVSIVHQHARGSYKSLSLLYIHIINMIRYFNKWGWFFDFERKLINKRIRKQYE
ncbi:MAG: glycosyltransferase family 2 protein [Segetibacter sp.]|jgi:GT2 family glycosyltransferase|nr:glycosyltransferase family 2 protein [Segetibacter sp.]